MFSEEFYQKWDEEEAERQKRLESVNKLYRRGIYSEQDVRDAIIHDRAITPEEVDSIIG